MTGFIILLILLVIVAAIGFYLTSQLIYPRTVTHQEAETIEVEAGRIRLEDWKRMPVEEVSVRSPYGYDLYARYIPYPGSHKTVLFAHGITYNLLGAVKYLPLFYERGFNLMLFDERNHGKSGGKNCTFGYYEKYDLMAVTDWILNRMGGAGTVGVHGESMGAAIALQAAAIDDRLSFVISDCAYSDLTRLLMYRLHTDYHLPAAIFLPIASFICAQLTGMSFDTVSPVRDISSISTPILFIHGQEDRYILPEMSTEMYNRKSNGIRTLYLVPGARHAESFSKDRASYNQVVGQFLMRIGLEE